MRCEDCPGRTFACLKSSTGYDLLGLEQAWAELTTRGRQLGIAADDVDGWGMVGQVPLEL